MISFKSIQIKNYKGYVDSGEIEFNVPDGTTPGSGLNIFVGENGSGKTTILKAISLLTSNSQRNKISCADFNNNTDLPEISINAKFTIPFKYKIPALFREIQAREFKLSIKHRSSKSPGRMFSDMFQVSNIVEPISRTYTTKTVGTKTISDYFLQYDPDNVVDDDLNIFYFDRSRNLQTRNGYSTTLTHALEDLNWKYLLATSSQQDVLDAWRVYYSKVVTAPLGAGVSAEFKTKFGDNLFDKVTLELLNLKEPFLTGFFAKTSDTNLSQIPLSELGSGVELVFSLLFLKHISEGSKGTIIYCIDEPELSLHPQWQRILFELLKTEAKTKQIFISTHSSHFVDASLLPNIKKISCDQSGNISIKSLSSSVVSDVKTQALFNLENREIFFCKSMILVEGWEDKDRIRKFLQTNNNNFFVIAGLQNFTRVKKVCDELEIQFKAIVDLDYLRNYPDLIPDINQQEIDSLDEIVSLNEIVNATTDELVKKEAAKIINKIEKEQLCLLSSKIKSKMSSDSAYAAKIVAKIESLKTLKTYVLPNGVIEDYLDENGNPKSVELGDNLLSIIQS